ncbi:MAG: hypothetical protein ACYDCQ_17180, partial [Dehalococcoidia bacterium]
MVQQLRVQEPEPEPKSKNDELIDIWPVAPMTLAETGLSPVMVEELALKTIHYAGPSTMEHLSRRLGLALPIIEEVTDALKTTGMVEAVASNGYSGQQYSMLGYRFALSGRGEQRVSEALSRSRYAGLAPVPVSQYIDLARQQSLRRTPAAPGQIERALAPFVLAPETLDGMARAFHSGRPSLIYGESGNGKTAIVDAYARSFGENVIIPGALYVNGQTIRVFDSAVHTAVDIPSPNLRVVNGGTPMSQLESRGILKGSTKNLDRRWLSVRRPVVVVGGELTVESLELAYDSIGGFYHAPPHLKAQDGIFVIDDFGRQVVRPDELLNRWIVPLERGYDLLTLTSGERLTVPFETSVLFSTNLSQGDLADEAFLRRIPYKVRIPNPGKEQIAEITRRECKRRELAC